MLTDNHRYNEFFNEIPASISKSLIFKDWSLAKQLILFPENL